MKYGLLGIAILATAWQAYATCNVNSTPYKGIVYEQIMTPSEEARIPRWNPVTQAPAISVMDAIQKVQQYLESKFPDDKWTFSGFSLQRYGSYEFGNLENTDNWWYHVLVSSGTEYIRDSVPFYFSIQISSDGWIPAMTPVENTSQGGVIDAIRGNRP